MSSIKLKRFKYLGSTLTENRKGSRIAIFVEPTEDTTTYEYIYITLLRLIITYGAETHPLTFMLKENR